MSKRVEVDLDYTITFDMKILNLIKMESMQQSISNNIQN